MHFRLLRKLGVCFSINIYQMPQSACYSRNSLRNYKLTLLGLSCTALMLIRDNKATPPGQFTVSRNLVWDFRCLYYVPSFLSCRATKRLYIHGSLNSPENHGSFLRLFCKSAIIIM